jgi:hypothetical protein
MSKYRGKGKGKPKPPSAADLIADLRRRAVRAQSTEECISINKMILKLERAAKKPRPKGTQPDSQKGRRLADAARVLQERIDARVPFAYSRSIPHEAPPLGDTSSPTQPIQPSPQPSPAALRQVVPTGTARTDRPTVDEMSGYRGATSIPVQSVPPPSPQPDAHQHAHQPVPPEPPTPAPMPPLRLASTPCNLEELNRLRKISADIDPGADRERNADRIKAKTLAEKAEIEAEAVRTFQEKQRREWQDQLNRPRTSLGSPGRGGLPRADYDVPEGRVCRSDQPEHRDGYFVLEEKPSNEARHNLTLKNF